MTALRLSENVDARIIEKGTVSKSLKPVFYKNKTRQSRKERRLCRVVFGLGLRAFVFKDSVIVFSLLQILPV